VVDHSINGHGGHYLSYALSILDAAKAAGYETILIAGAGFDPSLPLNHRVVPAYRRDFFGNRNVVWGGRVSSTLKAIASSALERLVVRARLSGADRYVAMFDGLIVRARFFSIVPLVLGMLRKSVYLLPHLGLGIARRIKRWIWSVMRLFLGALVFAALATRRLVVRAVRKEARVERHFYEDTLNWLALVQPAKADLILYPTISFTDCRGLSRALNRRPEFKSCGWSLLFRRNLFPGDRSTYGTVSHARDKEVLNSLATVARYFTDSEELTLQYQFVFEHTFRTLPIPHTKHFLSTGRTPEALTISYVGDARSEKGFPLLPSMLADYFAQPTGNQPRVRFTFQANYNVPDGEPACVVAKAQLLSGDWPVTLIEHALSGDEYDRLLAQSSIGLLPYERDNYYARTSGVLIEYLSAGIPVIVPERTWLARQFAGRVREHQRRIAAKAQQIASFTCLDETRMPWHDVPAAPLDGQQLLLIEAGRTGSAYPAVEGTVHIEDVARRRHELPFTLSTDLDPDDLRLKRLAAPARRLSVSFTTSPRGRPIPLRVRILAPGGDLPINAVGVPFDSVSELAECLREVVRHYDHYQSTALSLADAIKAHHNPSTLLSLLVSSRGYLPAVA
jgi:hypothetical protein